MYRYQKLDFMTQIWCKHYNRGFGISIWSYPSHIQIFEKVNTFICFKSCREQLMVKGLFVQSIQWSTESYQNELQIIFVLLSKQIIVLRKSFSAQSHRRLLRKFPECRNFLQRFPRTVGWLPLDGCGTNWRKLFKRSETDSKLCIWLSYVGLQSVKDLGKFFSVKKKNSEVTLSKI